MKSRQTPFVYDGLDPGPEEKSVISDLADAVKGNARVLGEPGKRTGNHSG
jgi:hypothetical protein